VKDFKGNQPRFVYYLLQTLGLERYNAGVGVPTLNRNHLDGVEVSLPDWETQQRISAVLSMYEDLIENNRRRIDILEQMARLLYREWFVHFRYPGSEGVELVASELGPVPAGWIPTVLAELVKRLNAGRRYKAENVNREGSVPVIDQSRSEVLGFHEDEPGIQASPEEPAIAFGDHTCRIQLMIEPFSVGPNVVPFSSSAVPVLALAQMVDGLVETREYKRHWSDLQSKIVLRPPDHLLDLYTKSATPAAELCRNLQRQNQILLRARDFLLPRLISGELGVSELELDLEAVV
jgi:type I restriction enzyme S subunit